MKKRALNNLLVICFSIYFVFLIWSILFKYVSPLELFDGQRISERTLKFLMADDLFSTDAFTSVICFIPIGMFLCIYSKDAKVWPKLVAILLFGMALELFKIIFALGSIDIMSCVYLIIGGLIGIGVYLLLNYLFKEEVRVKSFMLVYMVVTITFILINIFIIGLVE